MMGSSRTNAAFGHDVIIAALSFVISFYLRVDASIAGYSLPLLLGYDVAFAAIAGAVFWWTGLYRGIWPYASLPDMLALLRAVTIVVLLFFPVMFVITRLEDLPRSLPLINWLMLMFLLGGPRFAYRAYKDRGLGHILELANPHSVPVLLIGARDSAAMFIREMARDPDRLYRVVGIIGVTLTRVGRELSGIPVLGTIEELPEVVERLTRDGDRPQRLIITAPALEGPQ